ncbi:MAG: PAS domain-containing protein, partial [Myxococcales bacterium]|nr:PAS domain-containing protein [Myxococcales bacterium]
FPDDDARGTTYWDWKIQPLLGADGEVEALLFTLLDVTARYRTHLELGKAGVAILSDGGAIMDVNGRLTAMLGRSRGELRGEAWLTLIHPADREAAAGAPDDAHRAASRTADRKVRLANHGDPCHALVTLTCVHNNAGEPDYYVLHASDRNAEVRAQEQRERFFDLSVDLLCIADFEGRFTDMNAAWERTLGFSRQELMSCPPFHFVHPDDRASTLEELDRLVCDAGATLSFINRYRTRDGDYRWLMWNAVGHPELREFYGVARDVTEIKRFEDELLAHRQHLEALVRERTDALVATETRTRNLLAQGPAVVYACRPGGDYGATYVSPNVLEVLGIEPERFTERSSFWADNVHPADSPRIFAGLAGLLERDAHVHEYRFRRADGEYRWMRDELRVLRDDTGAPVEIVGYWIDITERRAQEEALRQARDAAEEANQAKSDFLSRMSHELRTPMNAILGFGELLGLDQRRLSEIQREGLGHIMDAGRHLLTLIDGVLQLAKIDAGKEDLSVEAVALAEVVARCRALIRPIADRRQVSIAADIDPDLFVLADQVRLKQVLVNLLSNAIKYNNPDGHVRVRGCLTALDRVRLSVEDDGLGIPARELPRLFEPFYRVNVNTPVEGSGIGLSICRRLVELMGGTIGVESELGRGSLFWIDLPRAHSQGLPTAPREGGVEMGRSEAAPGTLRVLYVEDNPANRRLMQLLFQEHLGLPLTTAVTGEEGLELARAAPPDLILLDLDLPGIDGFEVARALADDPRLASIPVVVVSAHGMNEHIERARAAGFADYLVKPINIPRLTEIVRYHLARAR